MNPELSSFQLYRDCHVLFGPGIDVSADFLRYLRMPGLKAAYRDRAMETHPDRAALLDCLPADLEERFKEVSTAYRNLYDYLENPRRFNLSEGAYRQAAGRHAGRTTHARSGSRTKRTNHSHQGFQPRKFNGTLPRRVLLFGQFVYYSGYISYRQLIDAIVWQKVMRPQVGHIARRCGWLYDEQIREILNSRQWGEKFGEAAMRNGYLTADELRTVLGRQRMLQPRIGLYFIEKKLLTVSLLENIAERFRRHNREFSRR